jgi:hypothetical protein
MSRPRSLENYTQWKIHLDAIVAARVEMRLFDPIRGKPRYGSRHELINSLLLKWLEDQEGAPQAREAHV